MSHLIHQHRFEIECQQREFGEVIKNELANILETDFYPKLQLLFDKYDQNETVIEIDQLNIPLPSISKINWQYHLVNDSLLAIEERLKKLTRENLQKPAVYNSQVVIRKKTIKAKELFFYFLQHGYLPNNNISIHLNHILKVCDIDETFVEDLLNFLHHNPVALLRFLIFKHTDFKRDVCGFFKYESKTILFSKHSSTTDVQIINEANTLIGEIMSRAPLEPKFLQFLFQLLYHHVGLIGDLFNKKETYLELNNLQLYQQENLSNSDRIFISELLNFVDSAMEFGIVPDDNRDGLNDATEDSFYFISNGGLIIIHPYLQRLFKNCGFTGEADEWVSKKAQNEAAVLLQYLFQGEDEIWENELLLNKVLCGFEVHEVVNTHIELKEQHKEYCIDLLKAVIGHWEILGDTSIDGLRETFLKRNAKLCLGGEYRLIVEEKGVDVLLDRLPWGISMIQTPWMKTILHCQWNS